MCMYIYVCAYRYAVVFKGYLLHHGYGMTYCSAHKKDKGRVASTHVQDVLQVILHLLHSSLTDSCNQNRATGGCNQTNQGRQSLNPKPLAVGVPQPEPAGPPFLGVLGRFQPKVTSMGS